MNSSCPLPNARPNASKIKIKWLSYIGLDKIASTNASRVSWYLLILIEMQRITLSRITLPRPLPRHSHRTEMSDTNYVLLCYAKGDNTPFRLTVSPTISMLQLREMVIKASVNAASVPITALSLWKMSYFK